MHFPEKVPSEMSSKILDSINEDSANEIKKMRMIEICDVNDIPNGIEFLYLKNLSGLQGKI